MTWIIFSGLLMGFCFFVAAPNFISNGRTPFSDIINNLRLIDGAKKQWALEHKITNYTAAVNEKDLIPYLSRSNTNVLKSIVDEEYLIEPLGDFPKARLTHKMKVGRGDWARLYPKGALISLEITNFEHKIILPSSSSSTQ